jgi:hypothetical protein
MICKYKAEDGQCLAVGTPYVWCRFKLPNECKYSKPKTQGDKNNNDKE